MKSINDKGIIMKNNNIITLNANFIADFDEFLSTYIQSNLENQGYKFFVCEKHGIFVEVDGIEIRMFPCSCCDNYVFDVNFTFGNPQEHDESYIESVLQKAVMSKTISVTAELHLNKVNVRMSASMPKYGSSLKDPCRIVGTITEKAKFLMKSANAMGLIVQNEAPDDNWSGITTFN